MLPTMKHSKQSCGCNLEKLLAKDDTLTKELAQLLQDQAEGGKSQTVTNQTAIGEDAQQTGQVQAVVKVVRDVRAM
jgi:hypothetical protein